MLLTLLVVCSSLVAATGGASASTATPDGPGGAQVQTCENPVTRTGGAVLGAVYSWRSDLTGAQANPCIRTEDIADADTYAEAKRVIAQEALEDKRYFETYKTQFETYSDNLENPAYSDARVTYVEALANGTDKVEAVTQARRAAHSRTSLQQHELWTYYAALADATGTLEGLSEDKGVREESIKIGYVNDTGAMQTGYTYQTDETVDVTVTNGSQLSVPAPTKVGNESEVVNPLQADLFVQVFNPETGKWIDLINSATKKSTTEITMDPGSSISFTMEDDGNPNDEVVVSVGNVDVVMSTGSSSSNHWIVVKGPDGKEINYQASSDVSIPVTIDYTESQLHVSAGSGAMTSVVSGGEITGTYGGVSNVRLVSEDFAEGVTRYQPVESYTNRFEEKHQHLQQIDNDVMDGLGTSSSGYLSDVYGAFSSGEINVTEMLTNYDRTRITPDAYDTQVFQDWMRSRLGLGQAGGATGADSTTSTQTLVTVEVQPGATVNGETIDSAQTYDAASLWSTSPPPDGTWQTGMTYDVSEFGDGSLVGLNYQSTDTYWEDGEMRYRTDSQQINIVSGSFTVETMQTGDGEVVENVTHDDRRPTATNVSLLNEQIDDLEEANERLRENLENGTFVGGGGGSGGSDVSFGFGGLFSWVPDVPSLPSMSLPVVGSLTAGKLLLGGVVALGGLVGLVALSYGLQPFMAVAKVFSGGR